MEILNQSSQWLTRLLLLQPPIVVSELDCHANNVGVTIYWKIISFEYFSRVIFLLWYRQYLSGQTCLLLLETDGTLRMLSISISTNYFSYPQSFLHTNIPASHSTKYLQQCELRETLIWWWGGWLSDRWGEEGEVPWTFQYQSFVTFAAEKR